MGCVVCYQKEIAATIKILIFSHVIVESLISQAISLHHLFLIALLHSNYIAIEVVHLLQNLVHVCVDYKLPYNHPIA